MNKRQEPNKPDAVNPATALRFTVEGQWRRVADLGRSMKPIVLTEAQRHGDEREPNRNDYRGLCGRVAPQPWAGFARDGV